MSLAPGVAPPDPSLERSFYTTSSCGLCGKASIDTVRTQSVYDVRADALQIDAEFLALLPHKLRSEQAVFDNPAGCTRQHCSTAGARRCSCCERTSGARTR